METQIMCPVCGHEDTRTYHTMELGVCEDYFFCHHCGYWHQMAYSPYHEGIDLESGTPEEVKSRREVFSEYKEKVASMRLKIEPCP